MGKGSMRWSILTRIYCRNKTSSSPRGCPENIMFLRHCHSQPADTVQVSKANSIKIGNKIYAVKTKAAWTNHAGGKPSKQVKRRQNPSELENPSFASQPKKNTLSEEENAHTKQHFISTLKIYEKIEREISAVTAQSAGVVEGSQYDADLCQILKQSVYCKENNKPFLTASVEKVSVPQRVLPSTVSVKDIIEATRSPTSNKNFSLWRETNLRKLGSEGFSEFEDELMQSGLDFFNMVAEYLKCGDFSLAAVSPLMEAYWESIGPSLRHIKNPQCIQEKFWHPHLNYVGKVTCIADYRGKPALIEIKKGSYPKTNLLMAIESCMQAVAKCGAVNADPSFPYQIKSIVFIHANADGSPANVHELSKSEIQLFWKVFLRRLYHFQKTHISTNKYNKMNFKNYMDDEKLLSECTDLTSDGFEKPTSPMRGETHKQEEPSLQSSMVTGDTRELENVTLSVPVDNQSGPVVEREVSFCAKPEQHDQTMQEEKSETTQKSEGTRGFFKSLWNMWK
ncbi:Mitochondrial genome maintenance exonuclease 1 [Frankliniella fusca]|uniref:Mitochondrial genome maintenance exonuclease 1 n=1 Tax=Frankliniella fusca TaxID=407009 RepID=A0AAE1LCY7_9NEOP|nr:Mitochondrial genome maintenance exonuclease 1 [Frankliniella fusca]